MSEVTPEAIAAALDVFPSTECPYVGEGLHEDIKYDCERGNCKCYDARMDTAEAAAAMLRSQSRRIAELERKLETAVAAFEKIQDCYLCDTGACDGNSVHKFVLEALRKIQE